MGLKARNGRRAAWLLFALVPAWLLAPWGRAADTDERGGPAGPQAIPKRYEHLLLPGLDFHRQKPPRRRNGSENPAVASSGQVTPDSFIAGAGFLDLPSEELAFDTHLPATDSYDGSAIALGKTDGSVCVLAIEDFTLRALWSVNGGRNFSSEIDVTGGPGPGAVTRLAAAQAADDTVYAVMVVADPLGGRGLRFTRSSDFCQTWSPPLDLVSSGAGEHGVTEISLQTGSSGFVSVAFIGLDGLAPYALTSMDFGLNWTPPQRLDAGNGTSFFSLDHIDVAIDPSNDNIYVTYSQDRGADASIWFTRSRNGGVSFDAEKNLDSLTPNKAGSSHPVLEVVNSGDVLIAYWDSFSQNTIYVVRSTDSGRTYRAAHDEVMGGGASRSAPVIGFTPGNQVIHLVLAYNGTLWHNRSTDNGSTFLPESTLLNSTTDADPRGIRPMPGVRIAETASGTWILAWSDTRNDSYASTRMDIFTRRSTDGGASWLAAERVDSDLPGAAGSSIQDLVPVGGDDFFVLWLDRRNMSGRGEDLYANIYEAATPGYGLDERVDTDAGQATAAALGDPAVTTDGVSGVYVAFTANGAGHEKDIHVARSGDGGYTFEDPVRVGSSPIGERVEAVPYLSATPDGNVYLVFYADNPSSGLRELRFNHSGDFGATWQPEDLVLGSWTHEPGYFIRTFDFPNVQLRALNGGTVYVAWSDNQNVFLYRSFDGGATHVVSDVDQDSRDFNRYPALCAQGDQIVLAIMSPKLAFNFFSVWGTVSDDRGDSWTTITQLRSESSAERAIFPAVTCDGTNQGVVAWMDLRSDSTWELFTNHWDGAGWAGDVKVAGPAELDHFWPSLAYAGSSVAIMGFEDLAGSVYVARSTDGGASFPTFQRLDTAAPDPDMTSITPRVVSDGLNAWIFWIDGSAGASSIAARSSADAGASYGPLRRMNAESPQGVQDNSFFIINGTGSTLDGAGFVAWSGRRNDLFRDAMINAFDLDDPDRDRFGAGDDCDSTDPGVWATPTIVGGLMLNTAAVPTHVSWISQDPSAGDATSYDLVRGQLSALRMSGTFEAASCLAGGLEDTPFIDGSGDPPVDDAYYFLVRARNACGTGSYGDSTLTPDPRNGLDGSSPCP
jgi:hypothetical protein